ncbi:hypothetical protein [Neolewinella persica]|uniref:hypothetical protein n=1 Tax=Neolewinella persica TaxID=70998 RepID=UPI00036C0169|nr:hypothetical protein [Neolewinella persica]
MRPGEGKLVLLLQVQIFLIIAVLLLAKPAGNAIFLSRFGSAALPYMFILTAVVAAMISTAYSQALRFFSILRVNLWSLGLCLVILLTFSILVPIPGSRDIVAVGLYLWVALFGVLAASQFWMMASLVFDVRQAKRLFGPIGAGAIAGGIAGGYLASIIVANFGVRYLLYFATLCLIPIMLISIFIWKRYIANKESQLARKKKTARLRESPHQLIMGSKHLLLLCGIIATSVITAKLVDYQFSALASERFADEDRLTSFFGFWFSTFNVIGLVIQLLITQRIVQRMGVSGALAFLPAGLGLGGLVMFLVPGLGTAIFSRLVDGSLKQSLHRAGVEMLFLPVSSAVKERIKTYIDVLIDSVAGGLGGLLLLLLVDGLGISIVGISVPVVIFSAAWLFCVFLIREEYLDAFRDQLRHHRPQERPNRSKSRHKEVLEGFLRVLEDAKMDQNNKQLLYVLERTENITEERFKKPIQDLLTHAVPHVRARALRNLSLREGSPEILSSVIPLLVDEDLGVRNAAMEYCISHHLEETEELIREQLKSPESSIAGTAIVQLMVETRANPEMREYWNLAYEFNRRVAELKWLTGTEASAWRSKLLKAAGRSGSDLGKDFIEAQLESKDADAAREAIIAAGERLDERYLLRLIDFLSEAPFRPHAKSALEQFGLGLVIILPSYLKRRIIDLEDIRRLPAVLERINSQQTVDLLFAMIERFNPYDLELRLETLKALNAMKRDFPLLKMPTKRIFRHILSEVNTYQTTINTLEAQLRLRGSENAQELQEARNGLLNLLNQRQDGNLDRLFRLLGLRYQPADIIPIYRGLQAAERKEKISALEFLEILLENDIKRLVIPVIERGVRLSDPDLTGPSPSPEQLSEVQFKNFKRILRGRDTRLKLSVIYVIGQLKEHRYLPLLLRQLEASDKRVRDMAKKSFDSVFATVEI